MIETAAAVAVCQHVLLKELQLPSWESWGQGKGQHGTMNNKFVGWEDPEPQHEMSGYPNQSGGWWHQVCIPVWTFTRPWQGHLSVLLQSLTLPPELCISVQYFWPMQQGCVHGKAFRITSITFLQSQVEISLGVVSSTLKQHRNHGAGP